LPANALDLRDENSLISQAAKTFEPTQNELLTARINRSFGGALQLTPPETGVTQPTGVPKVLPGPPVKINTKEERDKLPPGQRYINPEDGKTYIRQ
jgi:hypothetical protein